MKDAQSEKHLEAIPLSEQEVVTYLKKHPTFFQQHSQLLEQLQLPHEIEGTVSLVERQLTMLREKNDLYQKQLADLIKNAASSETLFHLMGDLYLRWFKRLDRKHIIENAADDIRSIFALDSTLLLLRKDDNNNRLAEISKKLSLKFPGNQPQCMPCDLSNSQLLFPKQQKQIQSIAILPLGEDAIAGVMILGSYKTDGFKATMDNLFLKQITLVLSSLLL